MPMCHKSSDRCCLEDFGVSGLGLKSRVIPNCRYPFLFVLLADDLLSLSMNKIQDPGSIRGDDFHDVATK